MDIKITNKQILLIFGFLYASLILGFFLDEDLAGGATIDFLNHSLPVLESFKENYFKTDQSPFFFIFLSILNIPLENITFLRFLYLHICLLAPLIFYMCLKEKFPDINKKILILLSLVILASPHFRAYSFWLGDVNIALVFLLSSIFFYLKINNEKNYDNFYTYIFLNVLCVALAAYFRPIYSIISIYFFYKIFIKFGLSKKLFLFILLNLLFSIPAFYFLFMVENFFTFNSQNTGPNAYFTPYLFYKPTFDLYASNILLTSSIIFFYAFPFIWLKKTNLFQKNNITTVTNLIVFISSLILTLLFIYNFDYSSPTNEINSGGIFFKVSNLIFNNNLFFYLVSLVSIFLLIRIIIKKNFNDILLIILLFGLDPDPFIYHKTYDPLLLCTFLLLFENSLFNQLNTKNQNTFAINLIGFYTSFLIMYFLARIALS